MIFYEEEYAKNLLNGAKKNKQLTFHEISLVAIYLRNTIGKSKTQVHKDLVDFCKYNNSDFNEILGNRKLKAAIKKTDLYNIRKRHDVGVTEFEMQTIKESFDNYKCQKVLFIMLVISKFFHNKEHYRKKKPGKYDDRYYVNQSLNQVFKIAKVHVGLKERYQILYKIQQSGLIETTLRGTFEILFVDENSPVEILITDLNNVESFFPFYCIACGKQYERASYSKTQLCDDCYKRKRKEDERKRMQKARKT